jgi:hypothetical protein
MMSKQAKRPKPTLGTRPISAGIVSGGGGVRNCAANDGANWTADAKERALERANAQPLRRSVLQLGQAHRIPFSSQKNLAAYGLLWQFAQIERLTSARCLDAIPRIVVNNPGWTQ